MNQDLHLGLINKDIKLNRNRQGITKLKGVQASTHISSLKTIETFLPQALERNPKFENLLNEEIEPGYG